MDKGFPSFVITALAYFLLGKVGLLLAIPPGFASAVWPASGVALFCVLYFHRLAALLGIAVGSFFLNLGIVAQNVESLQLGHGIPPLIIGVGAALQAWLGYFLFHRFVGNRELPDSPQKVLRFLFVVAPVGCLVATLVGVNTLHQLGIVSVENYWFSLGTWWVGDTIGVLLFTPLLLAIAAPFEQVSYARKVQVCVPILLIFSSVLLLFFKSMAVQRQAILNEVEENANRFITRISERLGNAEQTLRAYAAFFMGSEQVTAEEFEQFSTLALENNQTFQGIGWTQIVPHEKREAITHAMRKAGFSDFNFVEVTEDGRLNPAPARDSYYPVLYIYPIDSNRKAHGLNLAANGTRFKALLKARASRKPVATEPIYLAQSPEHLALIFYHPVFAAPNKVRGNGSSPGSDFLGYVSGVIRFSEVIKDSVAPLIRQEFGVTVTDNTDLSAPVVLAKVGNEPWMQAHPVRETLHIGGRRITASTYATRHYQVYSKDWTSWTIITVGVLIAAILQSLILIITGGTAIIQREVQIKTEALTHAMTKLEKANKAKSAFTSTMSHEIRTPLNGIIGLLNQCLKTPLNDKQLYYLRQARLSSDTLLSLVNSILDFSKIEAGNLEIEAKDFSLVHVLRKIEAIFSELAKQKQIAFNLVLPESLPASLVGDALRIEQMLLNLCGNAVKFTEQGEVTLQVATKEQQDQISLFITVADTGIGIAPEHLDNLFKSYQQADSSMSRRFGGTGLGLAITKRLIEGMGGLITVNSQEGRGSQFYVQLKLSRGEDLTYVDYCEASEPVVERVETAHAGRGKSTRQKPNERVLAGLSILVAEDVAINQLIAKEILQEYGAEVCLAANGAEALDHLQEGEFDLVLMDVQMPVKDGYQTTKLLRKLPKHKSLPIIAMTANVLASDIDKALKAGMNDHIGKPIDEQEMIAKILHWVSRAC